VPVLALDDTPASLGSILQWMFGVAPALPAIVDAVRHRARRITRRVRPPTCAAGSNG
jgi:hypothetical protein